MAKICFVSYEIHPTVKGGCGVLLHHSARALLSQGHEVIFLLDIDNPSFQQFNQVDRLKLPNADHCRAYQVSALLSGTRISHKFFRTFFEFKAYLFYLAAKEVTHLEKPDVIEFFEYCGVAYYALSAKIAGLAFGDTHLAVRLHSSLELIDREQPSYLHGLDRYVMYGLEHRTLRFAETVLYPSQTYLQEVYLANYEPWFGELVESTPALLDYPSAIGESAEREGVLFYGRLFGPKGVDPFVDAAVLYLSDPQNPRRTFYLVGYDSLRPPTGKGRYQDYLLEKIPAQFQKHFVFSGQLSWDSLGRLLPSILFAVFPSYLESFCYAAQELYEAGIPLIVSDIPAFRDSFTHNANALIFDGTVSDLAQKMALLSNDGQLRKKISRPYSINQDPLGDFYSHTRAGSWIRSPGGSGALSLKVCVLVDDAGLLPVTLQSLEGAGVDQSQVITFYPSVGNAERGNAGRNEPTQNVSIWFLGKQYTPYDGSGKPLDPTQIRTGQALVILKAGDRPEKEYLSVASEILGRQPQISYVGCWRKVTKSKGSHADTLPLDAVPEAAPYLQTSAMNRAVLRTQPGELLIDLFDARAGRLGELAYLWDLETDSSSGMVIPEFWLSCSQNREADLTQPILDYLTIRDRDPRRKERLARLHLAIADRSKNLRRFYVISEVGKPHQLLVQRIVRWLALSPASKMADRLPWLKRGLRSIVQSILSVVMGVPRKKTL